MLIRACYTLLLTLASPLLLWWLYRKKPGKPGFGKRWKEHFGFTPKLQGPMAPVWIHAASVGEAIAVNPVIKALKRDAPEQPIVVTTTTSTGAQQIAKLGNLVEHRYMPIDFSWCVRGFLNIIQPKSMIIVEKELWLNTLTTVKQRNIPIAIINGRLSAHSASSYRKVMPLSRLLMSKLDSVLCLHQDDAERFVALGANKDKVQVTGSIKYDISLPDDLTIQAKKLRQRLGKDRPIFVAASTHKGEDEQVLDALELVTRANLNALIIIVPRHPERFDHVAKLCQQRKLSCARRSRGEIVDNNTQVYLADTMGEMLLMLAASDITFMGGSLLGEQVGGHNLLEPAAVAKPAIIGPSYYNFTDITEQLNKADAVWVCQNSQQLAEQLILLFNAPERRKKMGENALEVVHQNQGAIARTLENLAPMLSR